MIEQGEYWLDEDGRQTFADGDVGDVNHEAVAYCAALGLPLGEYSDSEYDGPEFQIGERLFLMHPGDLGDEPITEQNCLYLWVKNHGAPKTALRYFGQINADARWYAVKFMGWIRVKIHGDGVEVDIAKLDQKTLDHLRNADFWGDEWTDDGRPEDDDNPTVYLNIIGGPKVALGTAEYLPVEIPVLFGVKDAKALLHQLRHPAKVVEAAAEGEDPDANFSLKGLAGEVVPFPSRMKREDWKLTKWMRVLATPGAKVWDRGHDLWVEIVTPMQPNTGLVQVRPWDTPGAEAFWIANWQLAPAPGGPRGATMYEFPSSGKPGGGSVKGLHDDEPWRPKSKMGRKAAMASVQKMLENEMDRLQMMAMSEPAPGDAQDWIDTANALRDAWVAAMAGDGQAVEALYHLRGGRFMPTWEQLVMAFAVR